MKIFNPNPYNPKTIRAYHKVWLMNFKTSYDMEISLEYVGVTSNQIGILYEMDLIEHTVNGEWGIYKLSPLGKETLDKYMNQRKKILKIKTKKS